MAARGAGIADGELAGDDRLVGGPGFLGGDDKAHRVGHALEHEGDGAAAGVVGEVGDVVGHVHVAGIARGEQVADGHTAHGGLLHAEAERAGLADHADGAGAGEGDLGEGHEGEAGAAGVVVDADAVGADDRQAGRARDGRERVLLGGAVGFSRFRVAGGEDDGAAGADGGRFLDGGLHRLAREGDDDDVGVFGEGGERGVAGAVVHLGIAGVHEVDAAVVGGEVGEQALAEGAGAGGGADNGDAGRVQHPVQLGMGVEAALFAGACGVVHARFSPVVGGRIARDTRMANPRGRVYRRQETGEGHA